MFWKLLQFFRIIWFLLLRIIVKKKQANYTKSQFSLWGISPLPPVSPNIFLCFFFILFWKEIGVCGIAHACFDNLSSFLKARNIIQNLESPFSINFVRWKKIQDVWKIIQNESEIESKRESEGMTEILLSSTLFKF